jgi:DHA1 family multidrug resistance protein-like MFS transporter
VVVQYVIAAVVTTAEGTANLLYAPYLASYGYALPSIGTLSALFAIFRLVSRVPSGAAYRPARARRQLFVWLIVFTVSTSGFALANGSLPIVVLLTVVHGYAFGALGTINLAATIDLTGGRRAGATMGWYTAAISTGYAIGAFLGGALADAVSVVASLAILGALPALSCLLVLRLPALDAPPHAVPRGAGLRGLFVAHARVDPRVWLAFVIVLYINVISDAIDTFFPLYALAIGLPLAASGVLKGLKSGAATFIRFISGGVFRYVDHRTVNVWAVVLMAMSTLLIPAFPSFAALLVLFAANGICRGLLRVTSAATVAEVRAEGQDVGIASGVYNAGLDVGAIIGPAIGGVVADVVGMGPMFQLVAASSLAFYLVVSLATARGRAALVAGVRLVPPRTPAT